MAAYIAIFLSSISIILMIIILIKFKKLFSTEHIIEKTKKKLNMVINDVNNTTSRSIDLINESSKRTKALMNDADRKMDQFRQATQLLRELIAQVEQIEPKNQNKNLPFKSKNSDYSKPKQTFNQAYLGNKNPYINPNDAYEIKKKDEEGQQLLFEDEASKSVLTDETKINSDGAAYKEIPLIITKIYDDEETSKQKNNKNINNKVETLFRQGMNVEDIAAELSCSIAEVQFIIDML